MRCGAPEETGKSSRVHRTKQSWRLISRIYEAATDPSVWPAVLAQLSEELDSAAALLVTRDRESGSCRIGFAHGVAPGPRPGDAGVLEIPNCFTCKAQLRTPVGTVIPTDTLFPASDFQRTRIFKQVLEPQSVRRVLYAPISREGSREVVLLLGRSERAGRYTADEIEQCQLIVEQVSRAWQLGRARLKVVLTGLLEVLNELSVGVALFDADGEVLAKNEAARALVADIDKRAADTKNGNAKECCRTKHLWKLISDGTQGGGEGKKKPLRALSLARSSARRPILVLVCPISLLGAAAGDYREGTVAFLSVPNRPAAQYSEELLRTVYVLTPAEARLAALVAQGLSINEVADDLAISIHTARTHLKRAFHKIGVDRQVDLVQLLSTSVGFLRAPD